MTFPVFPSITLRLSRPQYELIAPGFRRIADRYALYVANGVKPISFILNLSPRPQSVEGKYDQVLLAALIDLGDRFASLFSAPVDIRRLPLTALEIEFLMFATRVTRKQVEHGHVNRPAGSSTAKIKRLLLWLEARRKRAKRRWLSALRVRNAYSQLQVRWTRLMPWIRCSLLYCICHRMPPKGIRRLQRRNVAHVMSLGSEILQRESLQALKIAHCKNSRGRFFEAFGTNITPRSASSCGPTTGPRRVSPTF